MNGAGERLQTAAAEALRGIDGLGVHDGPPVQAAYPYAIVEAGFEADWSHKSGLGREVRLAVTIRDKGERPVRLRELASQAEAVLDGLAGGLEGWRIISFRFLRSRLVADGKGGWASAIDYRARMLAEAAA